MNEKELKDSVYKLFEESEKNFNIKKCNEVSFAVILLFKENNMTGLETKVALSLIADFDLTMSTIKTIQNE
jgi:hypothetical protein